MEETEWEKVPKMLNYMDVHLSLVFSLEQGNLVLIHMLVWNGAGRSLSVLGS